jgi:hypothetical protein
MIKRYIVQNSKGEYQTGYSAELGEKTAKKYAFQTARQINGKVGEVDNEDNIKIIFGEKKEDNK